jgi:hypothetical protein
MKQFCYVIINNAGHSWPALTASDAETPRDTSIPILPQLLQDSWVPVRETPMGGGSSQLAHSLVLLEKETASKSTRSGKKTK